MKSIFIGFDFSMNKPACTILYDKKFYHYIWPLKMKDKLAKLYQKANVSVTVRNLESVSVKKEENSQIVLEHTIRSTQLANMIVDDLEKFIEEHNAQESPIYVSSEGLSFGSRGDAALNLSLYKGVLLSKIYEHFFGRLYGLYTYPPITLKSVAGCASKKDLANKHKMIEAFMKQENVDSDFRNMLKQKLFNTRVNYYQCVDDIADSYWALAAMIKKEGFI